MTREEIDALPDSLTITLAKPIQHGAAAYTELRLREPTAAEIKSMLDKTGIESDILGVSIVAEVPFEVVAQLPARKFKQSAEFLTGFLQSATTTSN